VAAFTALAIGLLVAGTATKVAGQVKAGNAAERAGEAEQQAKEAEGQLADYNASVAQLQAQDAVARGAQEESRFRSGVRGLAGSQKAGFAAGNVDVGFGSAVDVQADTAFLGELDALTIRTNAAREAWGYKVQAEDLTRRGQIARMEGAQAREAGKAAKSGSRWATAGSILEGASGAVSIGQRYGFGSGAPSGPRDLGPVSGAMLPGHTSTPT
jgi:hypothetical protein